MSVFLYHGLDFSNVDSVIGAALSQLVKNYGVSFCFLLISELYFLFIACDPKFDAKFGNAFTKRLFLYVYLSVLFLFVIFASDLWQTLLIEYKALHVFINTLRNGVEFDLFSSFYLSFFVCLYFLFKIALYYSTLFPMLYFLFKYFVNFSANHSDYMADTLLFIIFSSMVFALILYY